MTFTEILNSQKEVITLLLNAKRKDKLVHAYLFEGDNGTGTLEVAKYFAMMMLCEEEVPCLKCNTCERIEYNSHLNVVIIEAIGDYIRKEQIENLMHDFSLTSLEKGPQIYIIKDAEKMNSSASNALLKFLEEPAPNHYAILTTTNHTRLLDTIVSRCQHIHFKPAARTLISEQLITEDIDTDLAFIASTVTNDLVYARKLVTEGKLNNYLNLARKIVLSRKKDPYVEYYINKNLLLDESNKEWHRIFFDILILIYKEILYTLSGNEPEHFKELVEQSKRTDLTKEKVISNLNLLNNYEERLNYNVNIDLLYTSLFTQL